MVKKFEDMFTPFETMDGPIPNAHRTTACTLAAVAQQKWE